MKICGRNNTSQDITQDPCSGSASDAVPMICVCACLRHGSRCPWQQVGCCIQPSAHLCQRCSSVATGPTSCQRRTQLSRCRSSPLSSQLCSWTCPCRLLARRQCWVPHAAGRHTLQVQKGMVWCKFYQDYYRISNKLITVKKKSKIKK